MDDWTKRLCDRMAHRQLTKAEVIRHVRIDHKTLDRFLTGALDHGLQPDRFLRLCEVLAISPNQALGVEPMDRADSMTIDALAPERARILERAQTLSREDRRLVADLLDRLAIIEWEAGVLRSEGKTVAAPSGPLNRRHWESLEQRHGLLARPDHRPSGDA